MSDKMNRNGKPKYYLKTNISDVLFGSRVYWNKNEKPYVLNPFDPSCRVYITPGNDHIVMRIGDYEAELLNYKNLSRK